MLEHCKYNSRKKNRICFDKLNLAYALAIIITKVILPLVSTQNFFSNRYRFMTRLIKRTVTFKTKIALSGNRQPRQRTSTNVNSAENSYTKKTRSCIYSKGYLLRTIHTGLPDSDCCSMRKLTGCRQRRTVMIANTMITP